VLDDDVNVNDDVDDDEDDDDDDDDDEDDVDTDNNDHDDVIKYYSILGSIRMTIHVTRRSVSRKERKRTKRDGCYRLRALH